MEFLLWMRSQWMPPASTCMESHLFHNFYHGCLRASLSLRLWLPSCMGSLQWQISQTHLFDIYWIDQICFPIQVILLLLVLLCSSLLQLLSGWWPMCTQSHSLFPITCIVSSIPQTSFSFLSWEVHFSMCDNDLLL